MRTTHYTWLTAAGMAIALSGCASEPMSMPNTAALPTNPMPVAAAIQPALKVETVAVPTTETLDSEMAAWQRWQALHNIQPETPSVHHTSSARLPQHHEVAPSHRTPHRSSSSMSVPHSETAHHSTTATSQHPRHTARPVESHPEVVSRPHVTHTQRHPSIHQVLTPSQGHSAVHRKMPHAVVKPEHTPVVNKYTQRLEKVFKEWKGTPYVYGGTSRRGIDCSAFVQVVYRQVYGIDLPRTTLQQVKWGHRVSRSDIQQGDLIFFHTGVNTRHVGVYFDDGRFMESSSSRGVIMSELSNPYWRRHFWQVRRIV